MNKHIAFLYKKPAIIVTIINGCIGSVLFGWLFYKNIDTNKTLLLWGCLALTLLCLNSVRIGIKRALIGNKLNK